MTNQSIINRIIEACDRFDVGQLDGDELLGEITSLVKSLEAIPRSQLKPIFESFRFRIEEGFCLLGEGIREQGWGEINTAITTLRKDLAPFLND